MDVGDMVGKEGASQSENISASAAISEAGREVGMRVLAALGPTNALTLKGLNATARTRAAFIDIGLVIDVFLQVS